MTVSDTDAERVMAPLVPTSVSVDVPVGVFAAVVTSSVDVPAPLTDAGVKIADAFAGNPVADRFT